MEVEDRNEKIDSLYQNICNYKVMVYDILVEQGQLNQILNEKEELKRNYLAKIDDLTKEYNTLISYKE